jgi:hypothetical protein
MEENTGGKRTVKENKLTFTDFVYKDRFELDSYLTYMFQQSCNTVSK